MALKFLLFSLVFSLPLLACEYPSDSPLFKAKEDCAKAPSKVWDCSLNACVTSKEVIALRDSVNECQKLPEGTPEEKAQKKSCMDQKAKDMTGSSVPSLNSNPVSTTIYSAAVALTVINVTAKSQVMTCSSGKFLKYAAMGSVASELYQYFFLKKEVERLRDEYKKGIIQEGASFEAQIKAFEFLRDEQKALASAYQKKEMMYTGLTALYGVSAAMAIAETFSLVGAKPCSGAQTDTPKSSWMEKVFPSLISSAYAGMESFLPILLGAGGAKAAMTYSSEKVQNFLKSSPGVATISGICAMMSLMLRQEAQNKKEEAQKNIAFIESVIAKFRSDMAQFCPEAKAREDMARPECFCYLPNNAKNPEREKSNICKTFWAKIEGKTDTDSKSYSSISGALASCIDIKGNPDFNCSCKKLLNPKTNSNGCLKSDLSSYNIGGLSSLLGTTNLGPFLDSAYQGNFSTAAFKDTASANRFAANLDNITKAMMKEGEKKGQSPLPITSAKLRDDIIKSIANKNVLDASKGSALDANFNPVSLRSQVPTLDQVIKKSPAASSVNFEGGNMKKAKNANDSLALPSYGNEIGASADAGKVVDGFAPSNEERNFKDQDIVKDDAVPIWTILSNRYIKSGYRRLFDEETPKDTSQNSEVKKQ